MPVTIKDIARRVGKSITTVSRALHDYDDVSPKTKAEVRRVAEELGYRANKQALSLQKRRSDTLGLVLPTFGPRFSDPFFSEFIAGVGNAAAAHNFDLLVATRPPGPQEEDAYRSFVQSGRVDGFILVRVRAKDPRVEYLQRCGVPFVCFGRTLENPDFAYVDEDGAAGMRKIAEHLLALGHKRFGMITSPPELTFSVLRMRGLQQVIEQAGLVWNEVQQVSGNLTQQGGYEAARILLENPQPPTALVAGNDLMAIGALSAAQERGLIVGKQVSITGFDDIPMAAHSHPPLTTLQQPIYQIGKMVCGMLLQLLTGEPFAQHQVLLQPELVIRQSTGPATH
jgi:DNA-binding LacI/PurR family transcriptional regulator